MLNKTKIWKNDTMKRTEAHRERERNVNIAKSVKQSYTFFPISYDEF